jgi:hypothetical protein
MAERWSYRVVPWAKCLTEGWPSAESLEGLLKGEGGLGWELVAVLPQPSGEQGVLAIFKKPATAWS